MADRNDALGPSILAALCGIFGIVAFLMDYTVLGFIGAGGFILVLIWMIVTAPKGAQGRGEGGMTFWAGDSNGGDGGGAGGGGDGGGGGG